MSIVFAIIIFSLLIFVHELGHFLAAKASGVQVNEFSIFMGPAIWKKQIGETLYAIRCILHILLIKGALRGGIVYACRSRFGCDNCILCI